MDQSYNHRKYLKKSFKEINTRIEREITDRKPLTKTSKKKLINIMEVLVTQEFTIISKLKDHYYYKGNDGRKWMRC